MEREPIYVGSNPSLEYLRNVAELDRRLEVRQRNHDVAVAAIVGKSNSRSDAEIAELRDRLAALEARRAGSAAR